MNNYEKGLSGEHESNHKKNAYLEEVNTFDYQVAKPEYTQVKKANTFYTGKNNESSEFKIYDTTGILNFSNLLFRKRTKGNPNLSGYEESS